MLNILGWLPLCLPWLTDSILILHQTAPSSCQQQQLFRWLFKTLEQTHWWYHKFRCAWPDQDTWPNVVLTSPVWFSDNHLSAISQEIPWLHDASIPLIYLKLTHLILFKSPWGQWVTIWSAHPELMFLTNTVRCHYNAVIFLQNPYNRHSIAHPWGWDMECLLWI